MAIDEREFTNAIRDLQSRLAGLTSDVRQLQGNAGRLETTRQVYPASTNLSNVREMFLLEILRQKGVLEGLDLVPITEAVKAELGGKNVPWGASQKTALDNIEIALHEIAGDYKWEPAD